MDFTIRKLNSIHRAVCENLFKPKLSKLIVEDKIVFISTAG